jgi:hypothetical protein
MASLVVFGQLLGSRAFIRRGGGKLWCGLSALLISPAGEGRRSTICDFATYTIGRPAGLTVLSDSFTYEAMGDELQKQVDKGGKPEALIYAGELSTLLGKGSYGESIIPKLTDIIGKTSNFQWTTVKRGKIEFKEPCVNALFTSAPDWLAENIPSVAFGGGTWSRFLMAVAEKRDKFVTWSQPVTQDQLDRCIAHLTEYTSGGPYEFGKPTGDAMEWYNEWYQRHSRALSAGELGDVRLAPYFSRKHDHLLRLTSLLTISAGEKAVFTRSRFEQALAIMDWLEYKMPIAYNAMALSPLAQAQQKVIQVLERRGGSMDHSRLHRAVHRLLPLASHFKEVMYSLQEMGSVKGMRNPTGRGMIYVLRKRLDDDS